MSIDYKVISRKVIGGPDKGQTKYYASSNISGDVYLKQVSKEIERATSLNRADISAAIISFLEIIPDHLSNGSSVHLGDLGSFRISISSNGEDTADKVNAHSIKDPKIKFSPSPEFKEVLTKLNYKKIL